MSFIPDNPMFETPDDVSPGMRRYNALRTKRKLEKSSVDYGEKYSKPIKPNKLSAAYQIVTSGIVINIVANKIAKQWGINGSELILLTGISAKYYSWSMVISHMFYFGGARMNRQRLRHMVEIGLVIEVPRGKRKDYILSEQGTKIVRHFSDELIDRMRRTGIE